MAGPAYLMDIHVKKPGTRRPGGKRKSNGARQVALDILLKVQAGSHTLDYWLEDADTLIDSLKPVDRALANALIFGVLRWQSRLDWIIGQCASRRTAIDPVVRMILRLAVFQMTMLERIPASAAVNTAVDLTRANNKPWAAGFVNGLLRRCACAEIGTSLPDPAVNPTGYLTASHSFPEWIISRWTARFGFEETEQLCQTINTIPSITLRVNTLKIQRDAFMSETGSNGLVLVPVPYSPEGVRLAHDHSPLNRLPGYQAGWFQIQDEAAQLIAHIAAPQPGQTVWDACAGMGTKSAHLAQLMHNNGYILASDTHPGRLGRLVPEMQRLGVDIAESRVLDLMHLEKRTELPAFDCILVDAPCSGAGVMQRNPDIKWRLTPDQLLRNCQRQLEFLERVTPYLKPGGLLVYSVCSFEPEENAKVVEAFFQKHQDFDIERPELKTAPPARGLITGEGFLSTLPHRHGMDGFFAASLRKSV